MNLSSFAGRFRVYLLIGGLAWALIAALAGSEVAKKAIESVSNGIAEGLDGVEPFFVLSTFTDEYRREFVNPLMRLVRKPDGTDEWKMNLEPPKHPKDEPIWKKLEGLWTVTRLTAIRVYDKGLFVLAPALCSLIVTAIVAWSLRRAEGNPLPFVFHPGAAFLLIMFMFAVFASGGLICLVLKYLLIGVFRVLGKSAGIVASLSVPILIIEAVRGWLENAFKLREILRSRLR